MAAAITQRPTGEATSKSVQRRPHRIGRRVLLYLLLAVGAFSFAFPFYWMVSTSLKPQTEVFAFPPKLIPSTLQWSNYPAALGEFPFTRGLVNTVIIVLGVEIGRLLSVPLAAYAFARLRFPLRRVLFVMVLATMMLPYYVTLIPQYLIFRNLGWLNTFLPLTIPSFFGVGGAFFIFLLRQFYLTIPREYDDAALVDGCGRLRVFWHIILPQSKPALVALAIFTFTEQWNDYFGPLIYLTDSKKYTLALSLQAWQVAQTSGLGYKPQPYNYIMVVATLITLVPILIFFVTQRYFLRGLVVSGIQG